MSGTHTRILAILLLLSGAGALGCEVVWMRRLALSVGSTGVALTLTLSIYMGGLGLGSLLAAGRRWRRAPLGYGLLELSAASWALCFPFLQDAAGWLLHGEMSTRVLGALLLLLPPAMLHGATLPALGALLPSGRAVARLYAANTTGAVLGVLGSTFLLLPGLGLRGTELSAAACSGGAGLLALLAWGQARQVARMEGLAGRSPAIETSAPQRRLGTGALLAAAAAGAAAMALEVCWSRLGALLLGGSVYAFAVVLAVFLTGIAVGAEIGRRRGGSALAPALALLGLLAAAGTLLYGVLPHGLGLAWSLGGQGSLLPAGALLLALAMAGAPVASGAVFAAVLDAPDVSPTRAAGQALVANTLGSVLGAALAGLLLIPGLGLQGTALLAAGLPVLLCIGLLLQQRRPRPALAISAAFLGLLLLSPRWDPSLYAVGLGLRVHEFADLSPRAVERFAHEGWRLLYYKDGHSASVAVGESLRSGNRWLSLNGKVDASTGEDMPTQVLSGSLPVHLRRFHRGRPPDEPIEAAVVGLASGVTAHATLEAGARSVTVLELEPSVVEAAAFFSTVNGDLLQDPRASIQVEDARAWMSRPGPRFDIIVSEPSNPWITGVSNLFTLEYWRLCRARLRDQDGVFVQWVQLYALPPEAFRSLVRTFLEVFPDTHLYETIPGADALLVNAAPRPDQPAAPLQPLLGPEGLRHLAGKAPLHTDDHPWIEFVAPRWLHAETGTMNRELILEARRAVYPHLPAP